MKTTKITHHRDTLLAEPSPPPRWQRPLEVGVAIVGGVALVLGIVILLGGEDQYIGLWSDNLSWRVGDIDSRWGVGLTLAGLGALMVAAVSFVERHR